MCTIGGADSLIRIAVEPQAEALQTVPPSVLGHVHHPLSFISTAYEERLITGVGFSELEVDFDMEVVTRLAVSGNPDLRSIHICRAGVTAGVGVVNNRDIGLRNWSDDHTDTFLSKRWG